jgi:hypothetical protein
MIHWHTISSPPRLQLSHHRNTEGTTHQTYHDKWRALLLRVRQVQLLLVWPTECISMTVNSGLLLIHYHFCTKRFYICWIVTHTNWPSINSLSLLYKTLLYLLNSYSDKTEWLLDLETATAYSNWSTEPMQGEQRVSKCVGMMSVWTENKLKTTFSPRRAQCRATDLN